MNKIEYKNRYGDIFTFEVNEQKTNYDKEEKSS